MAPLESGDIIRKLCRFCNDGFHEAISTKERDTEAALLIERWKAERGRFALWQSGLAVGDGDLDRRLAITVFHGIRDSVILLVCDLAQALELGGIIELRRSLDVPDNDQLLPPLLDEAIHITPDVARFRVQEREGTSMDMIPAERPLEDIRDTNDELFQLLPFIERAYETKDTHKPSRIESDTLAAQSHIRSTILDMFPNLEGHLLETLVETSLARREAVQRIIDGPEDSAIGADSDICTLCLRVLSVEEVRDKAVLRGHILRDIAPYNCTVETCSEKLKMFRSVSEWIDHEFNEHRGSWIWTCIEGCGTSTKNRQHFVRHVVGKHLGGRIAESEVIDMVDRHKEPDESFQASSDIPCPLCRIKIRESRISVEQHVGRHLEDLAWRVVAGFMDPSLLLLERADELVDQESESEVEDARRPLQTRRSSILETRNNLQAADAEIIDIIEAPASELSKVPEEELTKALFVVHDVPPISPPRKQTGEGYSPALSPSLGSRRREHARAHGALVPALPQPTPSSAQSAKQFEGRTKSQEKQRDISDSDTVPPVRGRDTRRRSQASSRQPVVEDYESPERPAPSVQVESIYPESRDNRRKPASEPQYRAQERSISPRRPFVDTGTARVRPSSPIPRAYRKSIPGNVGWPQGMPRREVDSRWKDKPDDGIERLWGGNLVHESFTDWPRPTPKLSSFLRSIARYMSEELEPQDTSKLVTIDKLLQYLTMFKPLLDDVDWEEIFLPGDGDYPKLASFFDAISVEYHLIPQKDAGAVNHKPTMVPALTEKGFETYMFNLILLSPSLEAERLQMVLDRWYIVDPDTGDPYPMRLPRDCLPRSAHSGATNAYLDIQGSYLQDRIHPATFVGSQPYKKYVPVEVRASHPRHVQVPPVSEGFKIIDVIDEESIRAQPSTDDAKVWTEIEKTVVSREALVDCELTFHEGRRRHDDVPCWVVHDRLSRAEVDRLVEITNTNNRSSAPRFDRTDPSAWEPQEGRRHVGPARRYAWDGDSGRHVWNGDSGYGGSRVHIPNEERISRRRPEVFQDETLFTGSPQPLHVGPVVPGAEMNGRDRERERYFPPVRRGTSMSEYADPRPELPRIAAYAQHRHDWPKDGIEEYVERRIHDRHRARGRRAESFVEPVPMRRVRRISNADY